MSGLCGGRRGSLEVEKRLAAHRAEAVESVKRMCRLGSCQATPLIRWPPLRGRPQRESHDFGLTAHHPMNENELLIGMDEADFNTILPRWWSWLLTKPYRSCLMNLFGDWFLQDEEGHIDCLSILEGSIVRVSDTIDDFKRSWQDPEFVDEWFLPGFVMAMQNAGVSRTRGKCYAYQVHPIIGGSIDVANLVLLDIEVWQAVCSQLHLQVRKLPPGTRVLRLECGEGLELRLVTEGRWKSLLRKLASLVSLRPKS